MRSELRRREWSAADLARRLGTPAATVSRWLSAQRRPSPASCDRIADVFGADVDLVLTLAGHRAGIEPVKPDDPGTRIMALLRRVNLTPDRAAGLEATLAAWIDFDRRARSNGG